MSARLAEFFDKVEKSRILKYIEDGNYTDSQKEKLKLEWNNIDWSLVYSYQNNKQAQLVAEYRINNITTPMLQKKRTGSTPAVAYILFT